MFALTTWFAFWCSAAGWLQQQQDRFFEASAGARAAFLGFPLLVFFTHRTRFSKRFCARRKDYDHEDKEKAPPSDRAASKDLDISIPIYSLDQYPVDEKK